MEGPVGLVHPQQTAAELEKLGQRPVVKATVKRRRDGSPSSFFPFSLSCVCYYGTSLSSHRSNCLALSEIYLGVASAVQPHFSGDASTMSLGQFSSLRISQSKLARTFAPSFMRNLGSQFHRKRALEAIFLLSSASSFLPAALQHLESTGNQHENHTWLKPTSDGECN